MSDGEMQVATSGKTIPRNDLCPVCGSNMLYHVDQSERVLDRFCPNSDCAEFCVALTERSEEEQP